MFNATWKLVFLVNSCEFSAQFGTRSCWKRQSFSQLPHRGVEKHWSRLASQSIFVRLTAAGSGRTAACRRSPPCAPSRSPAGRGRPPGAGSARRRTTPETSSHWALCIARSTAPEKARQEERQVTPRPTLSQCCSSDWPTNRLKVRYALISQETLQKQYKFCHNTQTVLQTSNTFSVYFS